MNELILRYDDKRVWLETAVPVTGNRLSVQYVGTTYPEGPVVIMRLLLINRRIAAVGFINPLTEGEALRVLSKTSQLPLNSPQNIINQNGVVRAELATFCYLYNKMTVLRPDWGEVVRRATAEFVP